MQPQTGAYTAGILKVQRKRLFLMGQILKTCGFYDLGKTRKKIIGLTEELIKQFAFKMSH